MPTRPILITGASGQLGHALATRAPAAGLPARAVPAILAQDETT